MRHFILSSFLVLACALPAFALTGVLDWSGYTDASVTKYTVVRKDKPTPVEVTDKGYRDTDVQANTVYCYTVTAVNAQGSTPFKEVCGQYVPVPQGYDGVVLTFTK